MVIGSADGISILQLAICQTVPPSSMTRAGKFPAGHDVSAISSSGRSAEGPSWQGAGKF